MTETTIAGLEALGRLVQIARAATGQARRVANDVLAVLQLVREEHRYPENLGFGKELKAIWQFWRAPRE